MAKLNETFEEIFSYRSLLDAHKTALRGKRQNYFATNFDFQELSTINQLHKELLSGSYFPKQYHKKFIVVPKLRFIEAPAYRDRVVQHALHKSLSELYEKLFVRDSYACRINKGPHMAAARVQHYLRKSSKLYVCQIDISKYYASINHQKLHDLLCKNIQDEKVLRLLKVIIESTESGHEYDNLFAADSNYFTKGRRGIPIGNLTSQLFANIYLHHFDMYVKQILKVKLYARYMDDIVFFHEDKMQLKLWQEQVIHFLYNELYLSVNPRKIRLYPAHLGVTFVGYKIYSNYLLLRSSSVRRFKKLYRKRLREYSHNLIDDDKLQDTLNSWEAHARHASSDGLIKNLETWQEYYKQKRKPSQLNLFEDEEFL